MEASETRPGVRIFASTQLDLLDLQVKRARRVGNKPSFADLIEEGTKLLMKKEAADAR